MTESHGKTLKLSAVYALGNLARRGLHFMLLPVYTYYLSTTDFGIFALLTLSGGVVSMLISTPLVTGGLMRFYYHPDYRSRQGLLVFNLLMLMVAVAIVFAAGWWALSGFIAIWPLGNGDLTSLVQIYSLALLLWPVSLFLLMFVKLRSMAKFFIFVSLSEFAAAAAVTVMGLAWWGWGVYAPVWGFIAGMAVSSLLCLPVALRHSQFAFSLSVLKGPLKFGCPLMPMGLSRLAMQLGDRYVIRFFWPVGVVGLYSLGHSLSEAIDTAIGTPVYDGINPSIRRLEADPDRQRSFIRTSANMYYVLAMFAGLVLAMYARELVMLFARRSEYWECWVIVPVVTFAFVLQTLGAFLDWGMIMRNKSFHMSAVLLVSAGVNIALNFVLIPYFGIMGAAVTTLVSYALWNVLRAYYSAKFYDLHFDWRRLGGVTLLGVGLYLISLVGGWNVGLWIGCGIKAVLLIAFPIICYVAGVPDADQKQMIRRFFSLIRHGGLGAAVRSVRSYFREVG